MSKGLDPEGWDPEIERRVRTGKHHELRIETNGGNRLAVFCESGQSQLRVHVRIHASQRVGGVSVSW